MVALQGGGVSSTKVWKRLWKLDVSGKIKIFGWRALLGLIPCRAILANRHISNMSGCPVCQNDAEDIRHIIFTCDQARAIWRSLGMWEKIEQLLGTDRSGSIILEESIIRGKQAMCRQKMLDSPPRGIP